MTFEEWMKEVDSHIESECGFTSEDLADQPYRDWYNDGMSSSEAARTTLEQEGFPVTNVTITY